MPLFPTRTLTQSIHVTTLVNILKKNRAYGKGLKVAQWQKEFDLLQKNGTTKKEIKATLIGLDTHFSNQYIPQIRSARSFRKKFLRLRLAIIRIQNETGAEKTQITKRARALRDECGNLIWPKNTNSELKFLELSIQRYEAFILQLWRLGHEPKNAAESQQAETRRIIWRSLPDSEEFTVAWAKRVHRMAHGWPDWPGTLLKFAFRPDHKWFRNMLRKLLFEEMISESNWSEIVCACDSDK